MDDVKVTVWCTAYNHERYLRSALEGFVSQKTNFRYEVIVHDDASTDATADIIREYEKKYPDIIKSIYQTQNQYRMNVDMLVKILAPMAKGKYIAFCEGDDFWCDEHKLQAQFDLMEANPNASMCTHKVQCLNEDGSINPRTIPSSDFGYDGTHILQSREFCRMICEKVTYPFHTCSYFVRKDVITSEILEKMHLTMNGDQILLYVSMYLGDICYFDRIMSNRRLMTIGNWNSRQKALPAKQKLDYELRHIKGQIVFDKETCSKFHDIISWRVFKRLLFLAKEHDDVDVDQMFSEYKKENQFPFFRSPRFTAAYCICSLSPKLYRKITKKVV